jgi:transposase, IS30 family
MACHLTMEERDRLAQWHYQGYTQQEMARLLGRHPATISRELARNASGGVYHAAQAQRRAQQRRRQRPLERKLDRPDTNQFVREGLAQYWSPAQIAGRLEQRFPAAPARHVAPQTIYTWIARQEPERRAHWRQFLRRRGRRPRRKPAPAADRAARARIAMRPAVIERRGRLGDFEGDTVLGPPGSGGLITLVDRRSRYTILTKISDKTAQRVKRKITVRLDELAPDQRRSLTFDNGSEFALCPRLEHTRRLRVYFAEPGRPYQRGTNENTNGLIRQFDPKGTDFRLVSHAEVRRFETLINDRPRACLGYRTPHEVFHAKTTADGCN